MKKLMASLCLVCLCLMLACSAALADYSVTAEIPVKVTVKGNVPYEKPEFTAVIAAVDSASPVPASAEMTVIGGETAMFNIVYTRPGVYQYTVQLKKPDVGGPFDDTVFNVTVSVVNNENGGLNASVSVRRDGEEAKIEGIEFVIDYPYPAEPTPVPSEPGTSTPTGVEDHWQTYLIAAAALLIVGFTAFVTLRRKGASSDGQNR